VLHWEDGTAVQCSAASRADSFIPTQNEKDVTRNFHTLTEKLSPDFLLEIAVRFCDCDLDATKAKFCALTHKSYLPLVYDIPKTSSFRSGYILAAALFWPQIDINN